MDYIKIKGLRQNNLKNINIDIPKNKIVVFTGVSGSGKSSIVFDTIAAESQRQMNETYPAFVRSRLPKYTKPKVELIENLNASVIVDQTRLGGNIRSTVGTISELYSALRLLFSRIGVPYVGTSSYFSFNNMNGMCKECSGVGSTTTIDINAIIDKDKTWAQGMVKDSLFNPGSWYHGQYANSCLFDVDKKFSDYSEDEKNLLLYGSVDRSDVRAHKNVEGLYNQYSRLYLNRDVSNMSEHHKDKVKNLIIQKKCPVCQGSRLNSEALSCKIEGYNIAQMCDMELVQLVEILRNIDNSTVSGVVESIVNGLDRLIQIGLGYLHLNRESSTLSGGEAQRLKLVRYMGSSLNGMIYIFDEPSTGLHPRDVYRMNKLLVELRDKGNTVIVVEHDKDVIEIADYVVDVGPLAGAGGGKIVFEGDFEGLCKADTLTGRAMNMHIGIKDTVRSKTGSISIKNAKLHNLKDVSVDIPTGIMTVVTGVAGSGKSTLINQVFAKEHEEDVILIDQSPITATNRSTPISYLGCFDDVRKLFAAENGVEVGWFSFNSIGGCKVCKGKGVIVTELAFMDPIETECEACSGNRYDSAVLEMKYNDKNILDVLNMTIDEGIEFFGFTSKIGKKLRAMEKVGLSYMTLGQPLSTLSGGERQRLKLAKYIDKKGNIYILDEPTTGLHSSDVGKLISLFDRIVDKENTVVIIEHNLDVVKRADYIIDIGPDGGKNGGEVVYEGTPKNMIDNSKTITADCLRRSVGL